MKKKIIPLYFLLAGSLVLNTASAQIAWTPEQKAVWKTETTITNLWIKGDFQSGLAYYDDSYLGWPMNAPIPIPKSNMEIGMKYSIQQGRKLLFYNAIPMVIWVQGNYAYTDYYYGAVWQDKDGKKNNEHGKWLDILVKKDGKWLLVGDRGGADPSAKK